MIDYDTLINSLQERGFHVEHVIAVPSNAGTAELMVNGKLITLDEARALLEVDEPR